jgi:hypothetical protein
LNTNQTFTIMKTLFTTTFIFVASVSFSQNSKAFPNKIVPPSILERNQNLLKEGINRVVKNRIEASEDSLNTQIDNIDNMPIKKVNGEIPNTFKGSESYNMPIFLYDDKKKKTKI